MASVLSRIFLLGTFCLLSGCCAREANSPFFKIKKEEVVKVAIGRTERVEAKDRGARPRSVFKPFEEVSDRRMVQEIANELISGKLAKIRLYYYDSVSVVFFDKKDKAVMAVEYFVISEPLGGCSPLKIVMRDGQLYLESIKGNGALTSSGLEKHIGWRFSKPVRL